jgi:hypothetical protein
MVCHEPSPDGFELCPLCGNRIILQLSTVQLKEDISMLIDSWEYHQLSARLHHDISLLQKADPATARYLVVHTVHNGLEWTRRMIHELIDELEQWLEREPELRLQGYMLLQWLTQHRKQLDNSIDALRNNRPKHPFLSDLNRYTELYNEHHGTSVDQISRRRDHPEAKSTQENLVHLYRTTMDRIAGIKSLVGIPHYFGVSHHACAGNPHIGLGIRAETNDVLSPRCSLTPL